MAIFGRNRYEGYTAACLWGVFNPDTLTGTFVDGVVASAHTDWLLDDCCPRRCAGWLPAVYQALFLPDRLLYRGLGSMAARATPNTTMKRKLARLSIRLLACAFGSAGGHNGATGAMRWWQWHASDRKACSMQPVLNCLIDVYEVDSVVVLAVVAEIVSGCCWSKKRCSFGVLCRCGKTKCA